MTAEPVGVAVADRPAGVPACLRVAQRVKGKGRGRVLRVSYFVRLRRRHGRPARTLCLSVPSRASTPSGTAVLTSESKPIQLQATSGALSGSSPHLPALVHSRLRNPGGQGLAGPLRPAPVASLALVFSERGRRAPTSTGSHKCSIARSPDRHAVAVALRRPPRRAHPTQKRVLPSRARLPGRHGGGARNAKAAVRVRAGDEWAMMARREVRHPARLPVCPSARLFRAAAPTRRKGLRGASLQLVVGQAGTGPEKTSGRLRRRAWVGQLLVRTASGLVDFICEIERKNEQAVDAFKERERTSERRAAPEAETETDN